MKKLLFLLLLVPAICQAQIPVDKQYHIGAGVVIGTWGTFMGNSLELSPEKSALVGFGCAVAAGVGKELWDVSDQWLFGIKHSFDCRDIAATAAGAAGHHQTKRTAHGVRAAVTGGKRCERHFGAVDACI